MKMNKAILGMAAALAVAAGLGTTAQAATETPIASVSTATSSNTVFTVIPGGDKLVVTYPDGVFLGKVGNGTFTNVLFSFTATGGTTAAGSTTSSFNENFTGGNFSLFSGATDLLSGTFTGATLNNQGTSTSGALGITGVTYDAASTALGGFATSDGAITLTFLSATPPFSVVGGQLQGFTASDSGVYSAVRASTVPEPATVVPFMLGGLGLFGLIVRKTRRTSSAAV